MLTYYHSPPPASSVLEDREKKKTKRRILLKTTDIITVLVILTVVIYNLILRPSPGLSLSSTVYHPKDSYERASAKALNGLTNHTKLSFNSQSVVDTLKKQFPEITLVSVDVPLIGQKPKIKLNIAEPRLFVGDNNTKYVVDANGVAVGKSSDFPNIKDLPIVIDQTGFSIKTGEQILPADNIDFIKKLIAQANQAHVQVRSLTFPPRAQELDLKTIDKDYYVKFYMGSDVILQSGQFLAARHQFDQTGNQPKEYLDVRVPGRVYFK
ncbi:MAG TPA: hypothetical protein VFB03_02145 [Candidatus Saccharimonadales bacterium]|nr:hypothetical protein [Candidatus Saccharimonadales bacterium]